MIILLPLLFAACGDGGSSATTTALDACTLLTDAEVQAAIGIGIEKKESGGSQTGSRHCHWYGDDPAVLQKGVSLVVQTSNGKELYDAEKAITSGPIDVSGYGDAAFRTSDDSGLTLYRGNTYLKVTALYQPTSVTTETVKPLVNAALARLP